MRRSVHLFALVAAVAAGCAAVGPTADPALTPAPAPAGWQYQALARACGACRLGSLGEAGPGYIETFVESGSWSSLDGFAAHWEPVAREFDGKRVGTATLPAGPAIVFEIDDTVDDNPDRMLRARWYLFLLPDGRGMNVAVGTYPDSPAGRAPATMEALRSFADRVIAPLRPAAEGE